MIFILLILPAMAAAQIIALKTVPIASGDQFMIFPSQNMGSGGISIALDDPFLDPFVNPAKGSRVQGAFLFTSPSFYRISDDLGAGNTLPLAVLIGSDRHFGGLALSIQQLEGAELDRFTPLLSESSLNNHYAFGMFGRKFRNSNTAIAGSIFWASLNGVEGVDLLYPGSAKIDQSGSLVNLRIGLVGESRDNRSYEALFLYNDFDVTHNVTYNDWIWLDDFSTRQLQTRVEKNRDHTKMWGIHMGYVRPIPESDWCIGGIFTFNRKSHPKIPNYELMNIPRDPGNSYAYNIGLGLSKSVKVSTFGVDFIYEPIWSNTWADAGTVLTSRSGNVILPWEKTVENDFRFSNVVLRMGFIHKEEKHTAFQLGLEGRAYSYRLIQKNYIEKFRRTQNEHWTEWTVSWGFSFEFPEIQIRYQGRSTIGTGMPGVERRFVRNASFNSSDILLAPEGSLTLADAHVITHQITISMPLGK